MKEKPIKKFKVIPFCISLLIVLLLTGGIALFTVYGYDLAEQEFVYGYLGLEENKNNTTVDYINKALELENYKYADASTVVDIEYRDPKTKAIFGEDGINSGDSKKGFYKNGIMHINGYFDVYFTATINESTNDAGEVKKAIAYKFFFFNVDYTKLEMKSTGEAQSRIYITVVDGIDHRSADEYTEDETKYGDAALEEASFTGLDTPSTGYLYKYYEEKRSKDSSGNPNTFSITHPIFDKGATLYKDTMKIDDFTSPIAVLTSSNITGEDGTSLNEANAVTFAIYVLDKNGDLEKVLVEGTIDNIVNDSEINEEVEKDFHKGYAHKLQSVPSFVKHTWKTIALFTSIAFVISVILAVLFYSFWIDEKVVTAAKQKGNNKKVKQNK